MASPSQPATVLVVDDDDAVRDALTTSLSSAGFVAQAFRSAADFVDSYRLAGPACLVVELDLPELDVLLEEVAQVSGTLPVIVTSRRLRRRQLPSELATCVGLLEKPFGHDELLYLVRLALRLEGTEPDT